MAQFFLSSAVGFALHSANPFLGAIDLDGLKVSEYFRRTLHANPHAAINGFVVWRPSRLRAKHRTGGCDGS
jgi:hypothetical protein